jgi:hypothetical protein
MMNGSQDLLELYEKTIGSAYSGPLATEWQKKQRKRDRQAISRLRRLGIETVDGLITALPGQSIKTIEWAAELLRALKVKKAAPVLWRLMRRPELKLICAAALGLLDVKKFQRKFAALGKRELGRTDPCVKEVHAVVLGLTYADTPEAVDVLVSIFERNDLPGWLRGDAADHLGTCYPARDRRTRLFQRVVNAAIAGLDDDISMQFGSMYVLGSFACHSEPGRGQSNRMFHLALPRLREIAKHDTRLSPGFWWPMSAEAEDAIGCIETGSWPEPDAADRWSHNTKRGEWDRP